MSRQITAITLRSLEGEPLRQDRICEMIAATARAIAERQGMEVIDLTSDAASITVTLEAGRIEAVGFAAELRRLTTEWYTQKFGAATLWGKSQPDDVDERGESPESAQRNDDEEHMLGDPDAWKDQ